MRRTSPHAKRLSRALQSLGFNISTRRFERWSGDGLVAPLDLPFEDQVAHYAALAGISRSGRDADVTARRLAARGFACDRLRPALLRDIGFDATALKPVPELDFTTDAGADAAFAELESAAELMSDVASGIPPLVVRVVAALRRNAARRAKEFGEPADVIFRSFLVNCLSHMMGGDFYDARPLAAVMDLDPDDISQEAVEEFNRRVRPSAAGFRDSYLTAPLEEIVRMAQLVNAYMPVMLDYLHVRAEEAEVEELASAWAPAALYLAGLLQEAFDEFPRELPMLPVSKSPPELGTAS